MADNVAKADDLRQRGNTTLKEGKYNEAIQLYAEAIALDGTNHRLYSNCSLARLKAGQLEAALADAEKVVELKADWVKGYVRMGAALEALNRLEDAEVAYQQGLEKDADNADLREMMSKLKERMMETHNPFRQPGVVEKLKHDPRTKAFMEDSVFVKKLHELQESTQNLMKHMQDERVLTALTVIMGIDIPESATAFSDPLVQQPAGGEMNHQPQMEMEEEEEEGGRKKVSKACKAESLEEKEKGNQAYKRKDFATALAHYDAAFLLDPTNVTFLTNKAAVFFEQHEYSHCISQCEEAVEKGREVRADFNVIAKALARIGNAYCQLEDWENAIKYFDKSLAEHRNPDIVSKRHAAKKKLEEQRRMDYLDQDKSLEAKERGNELFKKGDFAGAKHFYDDAIKRNPRDSRLYSNRAACYTKLMEFPLAVKDCDECIKLDPDFVKGYTRKGTALLGLKDTMKAMHAFEKARELDPGNKDASDGLRRCYASDDPEERRKRAMHDPEVQAILGDPAMQMILQQMQKEPGAIRDHLKNPAVAEKLQKLLDAGILGVR